jgi:hypothetical protein
MSPRSAAVRKASRTGNAAGQLSRLLKLKSRVWPLRVPLIGQPNYPSEKRRDCGNALADRGLRSTMASLYPSGFYDKAT